MGAAMEETSYAVSVIIPVYNKADSLEGCVQSLDRQTADQTTFEVVLIDDGSSDDSFALCQTLSKERANYLVLSQQNAGVSSARNTGIKAAHGRYLMFLDADDGLSKEAISHLITFFDSVSNRVDMVTYPILYRDEVSGDEHFHERQKWLEEPGVYSLAQYPHLAQTTINVCVRREVARELLFDVDLEMGEDQLFITKVLARKGSIGYCPDATYVYVRSEGSSSSLRNYPVHAFPGMIRLFDEYLALADAQPEMLEYCISTILYNIAWRIKSGMLFPEFGDRSLREQNYAKLDAILSRIPLRCWLSNPYLTENLRVYFIKTYSQESLPVSFRYTDNATMLIFADGTTKKSRPPSVIFDWVLSTEDRIDLRGKVSGPSFLLEEKPTLRFKVNGSWVQAELSPSSHNFDGTRTLVTKAWSFELDLPPATKGPYSVKIELAFGDVVVPTITCKFGSRRCNGRFVNRRIRQFSDHRIQLDNNRIRVFPLKEFPKVLAPAVHLRRSLRNLRRGEKYDYGTTLSLRLSLPYELQRLNAKIIWLYADNPVVNTGGNALTQILHDLTKNDGVERYYLTAHPDDVVAAHPQLAAHVVEFKSHLHLLYFLRARVILGSFLERSTLFPVDMDTFQRIQDSIGSVRQTFIYLQHGILHAHIPWYFSYDRLFFDYEVVSTQFEIDNLTKNYHFPERALIPTGAPRLDEIGGGNRGRRIAFIPSWRSYLVSGPANERIPDEARFRASSFFKGVSEFLRLVSESGMLEKYDYTLEIKLHPNFSFYKKMFVEDFDRIELAAGTINPGDYSVAITDYSSYIYDFIYGGAKPLFFVPDLFEFESGVNHYSKIDIPRQFDALFVSEPEQAVAKLDDLLVELEREDPESQKEEDFYLYHDTNNCERLYTWLIEHGDAS